MLECAYTKLGLKKVPSSFAVKKDEKIVNYAQKYFNKLLLAMFF